MALAIAPWCQGRRDAWRWRGRVPTAGRAVVWGARLEEPLNRGGDSGGVRQGIETAMPGPNQPYQEKDEHEPAHSSRHRRPHTIQDTSYSKESYRGQLGRSSGQDARRAIIHYQEGEHLAVGLECGVGSLPRIRLCREELQHSIQIDFMVFAFANQ